MGSTLELKRRLTRPAYEKIKSHYRGKDWEIVAMNLDYLILRIERENIKFHRDKGTILDRFHLGAPKSSR